MKVALYGDSYVDDKAILNPSINTWITQLKSDYPIIFNYGLCGVGPDYCLDKLRKNGGNLIIFFTGFPDRLIFPDIPHPGLSVDLSNLYYRKSLSLSHKPILREYAKSHSSSIKYLYKSIRESLVHRTEEILSYLSYYATMNECRIIAIPSQNPFFSHNYLRKTYIPDFVSTKLNTKYFTIYPYNIALSLVANTHQISKTNYNHLLMSICVKIISASVIMISSIRTLLLFLNMKKQLITNMNSLMKWIKAIHSSMITRYTNSIIPDVWPYALCLVVLIAAHFWAI